MTARTKGMPGNDDMRRQPPPGEVGEAKCRIESLPVNLV